jgi:hypothetical protein
MARSHGTVLLALMGLALGGQSRPAHCQSFEPVDSDDFCWFRIPALHPSNLRLRVVQDFVRSDRDQTISRTPDCQLLRTEDANEQSK